MKYCSQCGHTVTWSQPPEEDRERYWCSHCGTIHYQNPRIITGTLPVYKDRILLCRRAIEPRIGYWTLPAGFMENGETTDEGAIRETWEEAMAQVEVQNLYTLIHLTPINQVYMFYRAHLPEASFGAGPESLEVALFKEEEIPWDELAFLTVRRTLQHFFQDRQNDQFPLHVSDITPEDRDHFFTHAP